MSPLVCYNVDKNTGDMDRERLILNIQYQGYFNRGCNKFVPYFLDMRSIFKFYVSKNHIFHSKYLHLYQLHIGRLVGKLSRFSYQQMTNLRES